MRTLIATVFLFLASATQGAAISVYTTGSHDAFGAGRTVIAQDNFEGVLDERSNSYTTALGTFSTNKNKTNSKKGLGVIDGRYGRYNTTPGGTLYLDSFDAPNVHWSLTLPGNATALGFDLTDLDDTAANSKMKLYSSAFDKGFAFFDLVSGGKKAGSNGALTHVGIDLEGATLTKILFNIGSKKDGFGIDRITAYAQPAAIPLPAAGWMLVAGIGALLALRGNRKTA